MATRNSFTRAAGWILICLAVLWAPLNAASQESPRGMLSGQVLDQRSGAPIGGATVLLVNHGASAETDASGGFQLLVHTDHPDTLFVSHLAYQSRRVVLIPPVPVSEPWLIRMTPKVHALQEVEYAETITSQDAVFEGEPAVALGGSNLQQELGATLAETLTGEPGISQRTMGPAPARPVLRGLSGDRLTILEDGQRTGDLSATSSDHAVAIDPAAAHEITVARGPETVLYGPAVPGGVVDVDRGMLNGQRVETVSARFTSQLESVNDGVVAGGDVAVPIGPVAFHLDGSLRNTSDMSTPDGELVNTSLHTSNLAGGASWHPGWGMAGAAVTVYDTQYGIPGGFVGAHPNGVDIEMHRERYDLRLEHETGWGALQSLELDYSYAKYDHSEFESSGSLGMSFGVLSDNARLVANLGEQLGFDAGAVGVSVGLRDYATGGLTFTPNTSEREYGVFAYERVRVNGWRFRAGVRGDMKQVLPDHLRVSRVIGEIRDREFAGASGSVYAGRQLSRGVEAHVMLTRTFRPPGVEELFSEGPHLAAYSYEIGNPDLTAETSWGAEFGIAHERGWFRQDFTWFATLFDSYLYPRNTGQPSARRNDLIEYQMDAANALFAGMETTMDLTLAPDWLLQGAGSYVRAENLDDDRALERIPPFNGHLALTWSPGRFAFTARTIGAARQWRTGEFEDPTAAYLRYDLLAKVELPWGYGLPGKSSLHALTVSVINLTDVAYRDHLSRVKSILPEPGRNVSVVYRVYL
ncbi:TonB-dependent receptor [bacterium]|nr:TonB-dependent receptor [bacterium]